MVTQNHPDTRSEWFCLPNLLVLVIAVAAWRAFLERASLIYGEATSFEVLAIPQINRRLSFSIRRHFDETETLRTAGHPIHYDIGGLNRSRLGESSTQSIIGGRVRQA